MSGTPKKDLISNGWRKALSFHFVPQRIFLRNEDLTIVVIRYMIHWMAGKALLLVLEWRHGKLVSERATGSISSCARFRCLKSFLARTG